MSLDSSTGRGGGADSSACTICGRHTGAGVQGTCRARAGQRRAAQGRVGRAGRHVGAWAGRRRPRELRVNVIQGWGSNLEEPGNKSRLKFMRFLYTRAELHGEEGVPLDVLPLVPEDTGPAVGMDM